MALSTFVLEHCPGGWHKPPVKQAAPMRHAFRSGSSQRLAPSRATTLLLYKFDATILRPALIGVIGAYRR